jgi:uncharacterized protein YfaS (alpha-2-macroglobulin family)
MPPLDISQPPKIAYQPAALDSLTPMLVERTPARGASLAPDGTIELVFDRAMDQASVQAALSIGPNVNGAISWPNPRTLRFQPDQPLQRANSYSVELSTAAKAVDGTALAEQLNFSFPTNPFLEVAQVIPADSASDVEIGAAITVLFSRPVVALTGAAQQASLPQPLSFEPAIQGRGEWLGTAIYVFRPEQPLAGGATYTARIDPNLVDVSNAPLQSGYSWRFTTARPQILGVTPGENQRLAPLDSPIRVNFNMPIDPASAQAAFRLRSANGTDVSGQVQVIDASLLFTPTQRLELGQTYQLNVASGVTGPAGGAGLANAFASSFTTVPFPAIVRTDPTDGTQSAPAYTPFQIFFNAPIDPATVMQHVTFNPPLASTDVYTYYSDMFDANEGGIFGINFDPKPSTDYEVRISPGIRDKYGNIINETRTIRFRTQQSPPYARPLLPNLVSVSARNVPQIGVVSMNTASVNLRLSRVTAALPWRWNDWFYTNNAQPEAQEIRNWQPTLTAPRDREQVTVVSLTENNTPLEPGLYLLEFDSPSQPGFTSRHMLMVSNLSLTLKAGQNDALVFATDMISGQPVPNLKLELYSDTGDRLGEVTTGSDGVARTTFNRERYSDVMAISPNPFVMAATGWVANMLANVNFPLDPSMAKAVGAIYTDRPIYRPGQTMQFKGVLRSNNDARLGLPAAGNVKIQIISASGEPLLEQDVALTAAGTFAGSLDLKANAPLGSYTIVATSGDTNLNTQFTVAAYRPPEFEVTVTPQSPTIVRGSVPQANVSLDYFFGGPVTGLPINWQVGAEPYIFTPDGFERFTFSDNDSPYMCFFCWWMPPTPPQVLQTGAGTSDNAGELLISLPTDLNLPAQPNQPANSGSLKLTVEATAIGRDNQAISNRSDLIIHAADGYVGLAPKSFFGSANSLQSFDVVTLDTLGTRRANQNVEVEFFQITWENRQITDPNGFTRYESNEKRTSVAKQTVTSNATGEATVSFTPAAGGSYRVVASMRDSNGRTARSSIFQWVADTTFVAWQNEAKQVSLISERTNYKPGETANVLIPSPFNKPHWALITVERGTILRYELRQLSSNSLLYSVPLTADDVPNVYVSVVLIAPADQPNQPAELRVGTLPLDVEPVPQTLNVTLTAPANQVPQPGTTVDYEVRVTDANGVPVAAELSLDMVDKAVLTLQPRQADELRQALYSRRPLGLFTASTLISVLERLNAELQLSPSAGYAGGNQPVPAEAPAATAAPAAAQAPGASRENALDQAQKAAGPAIRENFADTAFWNPIITTDASGQARVAITLPDNLTTWSVRGVALSGPASVGEGTGELLVTKPLLVRPVTPRFLVLGDQVELAANVSNNTNAPLQAEVGLLASAGLTLTTQVTQTVTVPANGETNVRWQAQVGDQAAISVVFSAISGEFSDAARPRQTANLDGTLPVYRYSVPEVLGTGGQLEAAGSRTEAVVLPQQIDASQGELTIRIDPSLAAGLTESLKALENPEYESVEALVSSFLPNLLTARALQQLGIQNQELANRLPTLTSDAMNRLIAAQRPDGGWSWWTTPRYETNSNPHLSAYVLFGLLQAKNSGYSFDESVLNRGLDYLTTQLKPAGTTPTQWETTTANQDVWLLYVLAQAGRSDLPRLEGLYQARDKLGVYSRAFLALALKQANGSENQIKTLLSDLNSAAILSATGAHWEERERDWWSMNNNTHTTAVVLYTLTQLDRQNQLVPNVVRRLMVIREAGVWESSYASAWSILALTEWMQQSGSLQPAYDFGVWLNDAPQAGGTFSAIDVQRPVELRIAVADLLRDQANRLVLGRGAGNGRMFYTAHLRNFLPVESISELDRGITVKRRYVAASCQEGPECPTISSVKLGDEIRVEIEIISSADRYYLQVEDPLPAGAEAVDVGLATTAQLGQPPVSLTPSGQGRWHSDFWWWNWYSRVELRDQRVALFADYLPRGSYLFSYRLRATTPGEFRVIPTVATEVYFPEVYGRGAGQLLTVTR